MIPLLLAALPLPVQSAELAQAADLSTPLTEHFGQQAPVQTFDPVLRAAELAGQMPRQWSGVYRPFSGNAPVNVQLKLASVTPIGQIVDVRGEITVGSTSLPVQGNYNARSDQLDLLVLGSVKEAGLENGGEFLGLQGFNLVGWIAPRLTNPGGELVLNPVGAGGASAVRGLW